MINNITTTMDLRPQLSVAKATASAASFQMAPILGFKTPLLKEKAKIKIKKITRHDNIMIPGEIDDDYVDIVEEKIKPQLPNETFYNVSLYQTPIIQKIKYLKNCYIIDFIQAPTIRRGLGTQAIKELAEKAMFDPKANGRIVTFSAPLARESSPAIFFYKLGFRFVEPAANWYIENCLINNTPDIPAQMGMMYLPKDNLHKLLRYGDLF